MLVIDVDINCIKVARFDEARENQLMKKTYFCTLQEVVGEYLYESDQHLLLPESAYIFHTIHMEYASHEAFTISSYKRLLQQKKEELVAQYGCDPYYMTILPYISGEYGELGVKNLLGNSGKLTRTWYMYALSPDMLLTLHHAYGNMLFQVILAPRNLAPLRFFGALLQRSSFTLLTLSDETASLCQVRNSWYDHFATAPLGIHILLEAAEDQGVQKYLFRDTNELQRNTVAQKLLLDSLGFYATALAEWVGGFIREGSPLIICCPLISHTLFTEVIQSTLQMKGAFVLPFASLPSLPGSKVIGSTDFTVSAYMCLL